METFYSLFFPWMFVALKLLASEFVFMPLLEKRTFFKRRLVLSCVGFVVFSILSILAAALYLDEMLLAYLLYFLYSCYLIAMAVICCKGTPAGYAFHHFSVIMLSCGTEALRECVLDLQYFDWGIAVQPDTGADVLLTLGIMLILYSAVYYFFVRSGVGMKNITLAPSIVTIYVGFSLTMPVMSMISKYLVQTDPLIAVSLQAIVVFYVLSMLYLQYTVYIGKLYELGQQNEQTEKDAIQRISRETFEMYSILKESMDSINVKCHDLKHRLSERSLGNDNWSNELVESMDIYDRTIQTGNKELDTVLTYHQMRCYDRHITFVCVADGSRLSFMELTDIYTLFGNAISNATEYLVTLPEDKRIMRLYVKLHQSFLLIHIENYFEGELRLEDGIPVTQKGDTVNHGFGVKSMMLVAEKYGGTLDMKAENDLFQLNICFPLQDEG